MLLTLRAATLLFIAMIVGVIAGLLAFLASSNRNVAAAVLVGGSAAGGTLVAIQSLVSA